MRLPTSIVAPGLLLATAANAASIPPEQTLRDGGIESRYGHAVAVDGSRMVVGAPVEGFNLPTGTIGALHVYVRAGRFWVREARLTASQATSATTLGHFVAISGDRIVATAGADPGGGPGVYVFHRVGGTWSQDAKIPVSGRVSISGTTIAIGTDEIVHVHVRGATTWAPQQQLTHVLGSNASCGSSVAAFGDRIVTGCPSARIAGMTTGAALVYRRDGTSWSLEATLTPSDGLADRRFGSDVALADADAVIGAPATDGSIIGSTARAGGVYTYTRAGASWSPGPKLVPADSTPGDFFGHAVAISGDAILAGAPFVQLIGAPPSVRGAAHVFTRQGAVWTERAKLGNDDGSVGDYYGHSVATGADAFVVGAYLNAQEGHPSGAAFHYTRAAIDGSSGSSSEGGADDQRGTSVATAGNFLVVGGPNVEVGANTDQGIVTVYEKVAGSYVVRQTIAAADGVTGDKFGMSVATNASGTVIAIGAPGVDQGPQTDAGTAYVFERSGAIWTQVLRIPDLGSSFRARLGTSVALSETGTTLYVGAPSYDQAAGRVIRYERTGAPPGSKGTSAWNIMQIIARPSGQQIGDKWGAALALEGTQLAVGAPGAASTSGDPNHGLVQVLKPNGALMVPHTVELRDTKVTTADQTRFGTSVAFDGTDLAVGAPDNDVTSGPTTNLDQGVVETYTVSVAGTATPQQTVVAPVGRIGDKFGSAVASDGGVLVIGAPLADSSPSGPPVDGQGLVHVFRANRPPGGLVRWFEDIALTVPPSNPAAGDAFGSAVSIRAGTLALGAPRRDAPASGTKASVLVRDVGTAYGMPYVANLVFADGYE